MVDEGAFTITANRRALVLWVPIAVGIGFSSFFAVENQKLQDVMLRLCLSGLAILLIF